MISIPSLALTHAGKFHADYVFSAALLRLFNPDIRFQRVLSLPEHVAGLAFDIAPLTTLPCGAITFP